MLSSRYFLQPSFYMQEDELVKRVNLNLHVPHDAKNSLAFVFSLTMEISLDTTPLRATPQQRVENIHLLPCHIEYNGPAKVDSYFIVTEKKRGELSLEDMARLGASDVVYESTFRGRNFYGRKVPLHQSYEGVIFQESPLVTPNPSQFSDDVFTDTEATFTSSMRRWETSIKFDSFMIWSHDRVPFAEEDEYIRGLEWIEVANVLHESVPLPPS